MRCSRKTNFEPPKLCIQGVTFFFAYHVLVQVALSLIVAELRISGFVSPIDDQRLAEELPGSVSVHCVQVVSAQLSPLPFSAQSFGPRAT